MNIFEFNKFYSFEDIADICEEHDLVTVDCLKDEKMVTVQEADDGECVFEFSMIRENRFLLIWEETIPALTFKPNVKFKIIKNLELEISINFETEEVKLQLQDIGWKATKNT